MSLKGKAVRVTAWFSRPASVKLAFRLLGLDWKEEEHPRDESGRFTAGGSGSSEIEEISRQIAGLSRFGEAGRKRRELTARLRELTRGGKEPEKKQERPKREAVTVSEREYPVTPHKTAQFEILQCTNPMTDDYHVGIRKPSDIRSAEEALGSKEEDDGYAYPDFTREDGEKALRTGKITLYSSHPIGDGVFVSPSRMMSSDYAGGGRIYSKTVPLSFVAWINADEGQYAAVGAKDSALRTRIIER